jgi:hypothetical protein
MSKIKKRTIADLINKIHAKDDRITDLAISLADATNINGKKYLPVDRLLRLWL